MHSTSLFGLCRQGDTASTFLRLSNFQLLYGVANLMPDVSDQRLSIPIDLCRFDRSKKRGLLIRLPVVSTHDGVSLIGPQGVGHSHMATARPWAPFAPATWHSSAVRVTSPTISRKPRWPAKLPHLWPPQTPPPRGS
jgi:hypothetical protein